MTLDGEERELTTEDIVITVADKPVALAGVMGGASTEIDDNSKNVVLEAAVFDGKSIRKTSSRLNLRSESSSRFEKGINNDTVLEALDLLQQCCKNWQMERCLQAVFKRGQLIQSQFKFLQVLTM